MRVTCALLDAVEQAGVAREELLRAVGATSDQLVFPEARIAETALSRLCELALDLSGDPALGLHWAERLTVDTFVPVSYLVTHASTLGQALDSLSQFAALLCDTPAYQIVESTDRVTIRCLLRKTDSLRVQRFTAEMTVMGFIHAVRCFHTQWRPDDVNFEYVAPPYRHEYSRVFERAALFEQPFTGFSFDRALLAKTSPNKDEGIYATLGELAMQRLKRLRHRAPYAVLVREHLVRTERLAQTSMADVAVALGVSTRSLRRHLAAEGKSYSSIASDAFNNLIRRLLLDQALTIQQTAGALGFSGTNAFHRAFKRATGMTPGAFLEAQLGPRRR